MTNGDRPTKKSVRTIVPVGFGTKIDKNGNFFILEFIDEALSSENDKNEYEIIGSFALTFDAASDLMKAIEKGLKTNGKHTDDK